ncbi:MAG: ATP-binding protein [Gemmatimonadota bacterium]
MSVRSRLALTLAGIAVSLLAPTLYGLYGLGRARDIVVELRGSHATALVALGGLETDLAELDRIARSYVITAEPAFRSSLAERMARARARLARLDRAGYASAASGVAAAVDGLDADLHRVAARVEAGELIEASAEFDRVDAALARARRALEPIADAVDRRGDAQVLRARDVVSRAALTTLVAAAAAVLLSLGLAVWSTAALTPPLRRLRGAMARVAGGDLSPPETLPCERPDEIGDLARSFRSMTRRLAELDRMRAEFLSMTSHDLKTPISVIHSYAEMMEQGTFGAVGDRQGRALATIQDQARLMSDAVDELVEIGRIEAGGLRVETRRIDARAFFDAFRRAFDGLARRRGIAFSVEVEPGTPDVVLLDPVRMRNEVLANLVSNALKFTPEGGRVAVRAWCSDGALAIEVCDTGPGIRPDRLPHIFEPYYRATDGTEIEGSGLGLTIARRVVEAHGGMIAASSEPGRGARFRIELPLHRSESPAPRVTRSRSRAEAAGATHRA